MGLFRRKARRSKDMARVRFGRVLKKRRQKQSLEGRGNPAQSTPPKRRALMSSYKDQSGMGQTQSHPRTE